MHLFNLIEIEIVLVESTHFFSQHDCEFRFFAGLHDCLNDPWRMVLELISAILLMNLS